jgi:hypothetical protein
MTSGPGSLPIALASSSAVTGGDVATTWTGSNGEVLARAAGASGSSVVVVPRRLKTSQRQKLVDRGQAVVYAAVAIPRCSKRSSIPERSFS